MSRQQSVLPMEERLPCGSDINDTGKQSFHPVFHVFPSNKQTPDNGF